MDGIFLNLGAVSEQEEHYDESIDWSNEAKQESSSSWGPAARRRLLSAIWVGNYYKLGDFGKALAWTKRQRKQQRP